MPSGFGAFLQRMRSSSLSIGQITFGGFLLVLAIMVITSVANVVATRHLDNTFAELQRLDSVGDLAEEIDRRMNELRLAARDYVTDPGAQSGRVWGAASSL
ncbi:MAG TPA: histidine kinase, partial [Nitrobacter sp.]|nr:histidine kinase [Nitrobacter sp.]